MQLKTVFKRLGLGKHSDEVYTALLKSKRSMLAAHIAKAAGVARPQVYRNLDELVAQKFVSKRHEGKRTYYRAESPRRIDEAFETVEKDVAALTQQYAKSKEKAVPEYVRFLHGFSGIRAVFDDVIDHTPRGATFYRYTSERDLSAVNKYLSPSYRARRDQKKLERLVISNPVSGKQKRPRLERFIKYIEPSTDLFDQNIIQLVYGNRLAFINLSAEEAFIIEDSSLAAFQKVIFQQLYKKLGAG
ncbi:MAG: hypothetical protein ABA06_03860 [Parcubacteria bacterium C7867-001]|nr:MAG: hypothetical protein ABA06_03860 [Parcubacteria bacterium C7867-001]